ncbi:MAG: hypothetical protein JO233_09560 [Candidatus Eremiobacteraeota bacterium]|nr:hypothetical protein [Candidatus Eremiobacteraeota bacterium]
MTERIGRIIFALAIVAIGITSLIWAKASVMFVRGHPAVPIMPYPPAIPALAILLGIAMIACGILMVQPRTARLGAVSFAIIFLLSALIFGLPRVATHLANIPLRTIFLQPLTLAALAWMLPAADLPSDWRMAVARYVIGISLIVYGVDHFLALAGISALVPSWMPFHVFWAVFFGLAFIVAGLSFATNLLRGWAAAGLALMFAIFDLTLHIPSALGAYGVPGAIRDPDQWCSIFIVAALCGGFIALATFSNRLR